MFFKLYAFDRYHNVQIKFVKFNASIISWLVL